MLKMKKLVFGVLLDVLLTFAFLALFSVFILKMGSLPDAWAGTAAAAAGGLAGFISAFLTARWAGEKGLLHGLVLTGVYTVLYTAIALMLYKELQPVPLLIRSAVFVLCGALGGILGVGKNSKVKF